MEPDQVARQQPLNQVLLDRQSSPEVAGWKWSVEKKPNGTTFVPLLEAIAEELWQQHQMIVVHPNQGSRFCCVGDCIGEQFVDSSICLPGTVFINHTGLIMEDGPQDSICDVFSGYRFVLRGRGVRAYSRTCYNVRAPTLYPKRSASHHAHPSSLLSLLSPCCL